MAVHTPKHGRFITNKNFVHKTNIDSHFYVDFSVNDNTDNSGVDEVNLCDAEIKMWRAGEMKGVAAGNALKSFGFQEHVYEDTEDDDFFENHSINLNFCTLTQCQQVAKLFDTKEKIVLDFVLPTGDLIRISGFLN